MSLSGKTNKCTLFHTHYHRDSGYFQNAENLSGLALPAYLIFSILAVLTLLQFYVYTHRNT